MLLMFACILLRIVLTDSISYLLFLLKNNNSSNHNGSLAKVIALSTQESTCRGMETAKELNCLLKEIQLLSEINNALPCAQVGSLVRVHLEK